MVPPQRQRRASYQPAATPQVNAKQDPRAEGPIHHLLDNLIHRTQSNFKKADWTGMIPEPQKLKRPGTALDVFLALIFLFLFFRITAAVVLLALVLLYIFYPRHRSIRTLAVTYCLFFAALLIPFDVYVPSFHGPIEGNQQSGPRLIRVVWGMPKTHECTAKYGEFIAGGCCPRIDATEWMLVCN